MNRKEITDICRFVANSKVRNEDKDKCSDETRAMLCGFNMGLDAAINAIFTVCNINDDGTLLSVLQEIRNV